jgi:ABC-type nickel/cobalt efflux system permease component RcnA
MKETADDNFELLDPPSPDALVPDFPVELWMVVASALVVLGLLMWLVFRKKKSPIAVQREARHAAHAEAVSALEAIRPDGPRDAAVQCSLILRKYLTVAAGDPALFETHEETLTRHEAFASLNQGTRRAAADGFTRLAALKYAPDIPSVLSNDVVNESRALLETLHHGFQA